MCNCIANNLLLPARHILANNSIVNYVSHIMQAVRYFLQNQMISYYPSDSPEEALLFAVSWSLWLETVGEHW